MRDSATMVESMEYGTMQDKKIIGVVVLRGVFANETMEGFQLIVVKGQVYVYGNLWLK